MAGATHATVTATFLRGEADLRPGADCDMIAPRHSRGRTTWMANHQTQHDQRQHGLTGATALHRWPALLVVGLLAIFGLRAPSAAQRRRAIAALLQSGSTCR